MKRKFTAFVALILLATFTFGGFSIVTAESIEKVPGTLTVMVYDRGNMPSSEGTLNDNRWTDWIRENAPVENIEFVTIPRAQDADTLNMMFAAGTAPDLLCTYSGFDQFYANGMIMEITDEMLEKMPNYAAILEAFPAVRKDSSRDNKLMFFGKNQLVTPNHTIAIRKDWLDNLNLSIPTTPEELYDVIYAFTYNDPDGNGVNDTWGINMTQPAQRTLSKMFGFGNDNKYYFDEEGNLVYAWDRIAAYLEYAKKIVDAGCVNPDFITMKDDDDQADFLNGKIGIFISGRFTNSSRLNLFRNFKTNFPDATLDTFALPESEYGRFVATLNSCAGNVGYINADCKNLDAALAYVNWLYDANVTEYLKYGPEGVYNAMNEGGTYAIVDAEKNKIEFDWAVDYSVIQNGTLYGREPAISAHANDFYNQYLTSDDPILWEFGDLYYKMYAIANDNTVTVPGSGYNIPLPSELQLIDVTAGAEVDNLLVAALVDSNMTVDQVISQAKSIWYDAGGQMVDDYRDTFYKEHASEVLMPWDTVNAMSAPEMTEAAKKNSKLFSE